VTADEGRLTSVLGEAVKRAWGDLPQHVQELLFEEALLSPGATNSDEVRHELALLLHDRHPRTAEHA
jgi:hypothetical protein